MNTNPTYGASRMAGMQWRKTATLLRARFPAARTYTQEAQMHALRFGRKLSLPSTIAIKHELRKLMADDQVKKAEAEARAESTDIPQMNVGHDLQKKPTDSPPMSE
jgi:hypothetical protein